MSKLLVKGPEVTWRILVTVAGISIPFACLLIVFESLFVGITFDRRRHLQEESANSSIISGDSDSGDGICRVGAGIWAGTFGAVCSGLLLTVLCRRKEAFADRRTFGLCLVICWISLVGDLALITSEALCLRRAGTQSVSPLPVFQLTAGIGHIICTVLMIILFYTFWKLSSIAAAADDDEKGKETAKLSPWEQRRMITIPNILQAKPSFVSVDLSK